MMDPPQTFQGVPVFVSESAVEKKRREWGEMSRWERIRLWMEGRTAQIGLNWPFPIVERWKEVPIAYATTDPGNGGQAFFMHPEFWKKVQEETDGKV